MRIATHCTENCMKNFPEQLEPSRLSDFVPIFWNHRRLCYLRNEIYEYMIRDLPGELQSNPLVLRGFDLTNSVYYHLDNVHQIQGELQKLGWKTKLAYGNTVLFIYDCEERGPKAVDSSLLT
jgi:hypothetical protein